VSISGSLDRLQGVTIAILLCVASGYATLRAWRAAREMDLVD
jgi:hypothetical protein